MYLDPIICGQLISSDKHNNIIGILCIIIFPLAHSASPSSERGTKNLSFHMLLERQTHSKWHYVNQKGHIVDDGKNLFHLPFTYNAYHLRKIIKCSNSI